jgi:hypothetical protein
VPCLVAVADELGGREELIALRALCKQTDLLFYFFLPHLKALVTKIRVKYRKEFINEINKSFAYISMFVANN